MSAQAKLSFDDLYLLKQRVDRLRANHASSLAVFRDSTSNGFKHTRDRPNKKELSMSSTATCIGSLVEAGVWRGKDNGLKEACWWTGQEQTLLINLLTQKWESAGLADGNAFTVAFVVEACCYLRRVAPGEFSGLNVGVSAKFDAAVEILQRELASGSVSVVEYPPSAFLTQLTARALKRADKLTPPLADAVSNWASLETRSQLALIAAESRLADPLQLAFAIILSAEHLTASRQLPTDQELQRLALKTFFDQQLKNGGWPQSRPLFHYPSAGSAYSYDYEVLAQLLLCQSLGDSLLRYIPQLTLAVEGIEDSKFQIELDAIGWASNQTSRYPGPESWATASVYLFLFALDRFLAEAIRRVVAHEVEANYAGIRDAKNDEKDFASQFLDCPLTAKSGETRRLKKVIFKKLVEPIATHAPNVKSGQKLPSDVPVSAILFGPPGTSKTEIAEQISTFVGWPLITVDPSYFVQNGLDQIQAQANRIFRMLGAAEQLVVLFDEFDEMVRNRADASELLSRFLTTAMLPKLIKINKERRILFLVATNYIDTFDDAISRPGRFDLVLQMMPPLAEEKLNHSDWGDQLSEIVTTEAEKAALANLTYPETKMLIGRLKGEPTVEEKRIEFTRTTQTCTLARPRERSAHRDGAISPPNGKSGKAVRTAQKPETWLESQVREAELVRLN